MKITLKHYISLNTETQEGIYRHQGKGGSGANPGQKYGRGRARTAVETQPRPRFLSSSRAARAAPLSPVSCSSRFLVLGP